MPLHDVQCTLCGAIIENYYASPWPPSLLHEDGGELQILWSNASGIAAVHPRERVVVWRNPRTGQVAYPPSNTAEMPARYRQQGYERIEMEHASEVEKFEKEQGVTNEKLWYNSGNGV